MIRYLYSLVYHQAGKTMADQVEWLRRTVARLQILKDLLHEYQNVGWVITRVMIILLFYWLTTPITRICSTQVHDWMWRERPYPFWMAREFKTRQRRSVPRMTYLCLPHTSNYQALWYTDRLSVLLALKARVQHTHCWATRWALLYRQRWWNNGVITSPLPSTNKWATPGRH